MKDIREGRAANTAMPDQCTRLGRLQLLIAGGGILEQGEVDSLLGPRVNGLKVFAASTTARTPQPRPSQCKDHAERGVTSVSTGSWPTSAAI